jgi:hypothetical protein
VERFIARQNIAHFREELTSEVSPERRAALLRLLMMEEDKLGLDVQQLGDLERYIAEEKIRIVRQQRIVANLEADGRDTAIARALFDTYVQTLDLDEKLRQKIIGRLEQNRL